MKVAVVIASVLLAAAVAVQGQAGCSGANYLYTECTSDCDCPSTLTCKTGRCVGTFARNTIDAYCTCNGPCYKAGPKAGATCWSDCDCDGMMACTLGTCTGVAVLPGGQVNCMTSGNCSGICYKPAATKRCTNNCQCSGARLCNDFGFCQDPPPMMASCQAPTYTTVECVTDCDCSSTRTCIKGTCTGTVNKAKIDKFCGFNKGCSGACYFLDELPNGKCYNDCMCDGDRKCRFGLCTGVARSDFDAQTCNGGTCQGLCNRAIECQSNCDCKGSRYCSSTSVCT